MRIHDEEMAKVQVLTHLISRALCEMEIEDSAFATLAYKKLMELKGLLGTDSWELFETIQAGNPYAQAIRKEFRGKLDEIETRLKKHSIV